MLLFNQTIERPFYVNNKQFTATVTISTMPDTVEEGDFDLGSEEKNAAYLAKFESGELESVSVIVRAHFMGMEGVDSLGSVHVGNSRDVEAALEDHCMIINALFDLSKKIAELTKVASINADKV